ncbi:RNA polymerase sigma factor SigI [Alkaliphilus sp. B6464]|uniref:RNA polymerase sigma factor SigI n=1 Tax=Alkaliphilus sp. B6464 TaxID=2731219 RepID=UPI001BA8427A|nr:RNA polymerase sigma factor SigI [Alkaliphilus sp. B6464]QUH19209.1 RNA polymerase sigma factor SigI [Alkaliphilus sp. B6464]
MTKLLNIFKKKKTLEERVKDIQNGNEDDRNNLIEEYIPFIKKILSNQLGKYIEVENNDAFSIGLIAFNEAIEKYDEKRGNFLTFASMVIKSRLIDQLRSESRRSKEVYINQLKSDDEDDNYTENIMAIEGFEAGIETRLDMATLVENMKDFDVSLEDLINHAPKHRDTRITAISIGRYVFENVHLREKFLKTKNLPTGDLMRDLKVSKKVVQRSRKFIIAIIVILNSDLDTLKEYISHNERGKIE